MRLIRPDNESRKKKTKAATRQKSRNKSCLTPLGEENDRWDLVNVVLSEVQWTLPEYLVKREKRGWSGSKTVLFLILLFLIGAGYLFLLTNSHWTPVGFPHFPWRREPFLFAWEVRVSLLLMISFGVGVVSGSIWWLTLLQQQKRIRYQDRQRIEQMEQELSKAKNLCTGLTEFNTRSDDGIEPFEGYAL